MTSRYHLLAVTTALFCLAGTAHAQAVVEQKDKKFSVSEVTIQKGGSVTFSNADPFTHNVYSQSPGNAFDLRTQKPGESSTVEFKSVGEAEVRCAIHPTMRMKVKVTE